MYYESHKEKKIGLVVVILFLFFIMMILLTIAIKTEGNLNSDYMLEKTAIETEAEEEKTDLESIIKSATSCVVGISKLEQNGTSIFLNNVTNVLGMGSGVVVSEDGYILTNEHVSGSKYSNCYVTLEDGRTFNGNVVWSDYNIDLAIVKIETHELDYMKLADSDNIYLGQDVFAIGNPVGFEFQRTVTKGIVSGINRTLKIEDNEKPENNAYMEDLIQTDSTINEGNSGGPLINTEGKIIGINSIKLTSAEGMGFAVPINIVKPILEKLFQNGNFKEAYLGIYGYDKEVIPYLEENLEIDNGIYIAKIVIDGPARGLNLREGDIILKIDNYELNKMNDLKRYIYQKSPGDKVNLQIKRGGNIFEIGVILSEKI